MPMPRAGRIPRPRASILCREQHPLVHDRRVPAGSRAPARLL